MGRGAVCLSNQLSLWKGPQELRGRAPWFPRICVPAKGLWLLLVHQEGQVPLGEDSSAAFMRPCPAWGSVASPQDNDSDPPRFTLTTRPPHSQADREEFL